MMLQQVMKDLDVVDGVYIRYRLDCSLCDLQRLQVYTKTLEQLIRDLCFADDDALVTYAVRALLRITPS